MTTASVKALLDLALSKVGYAYDTGPTRTTGAGGYFDCSGFMYFLPEHLGVRPSWWAPPGSHDQALDMRDHNLLIAPRDFHDGWGKVGDPNVARGIAGALVTHGPSHSYVGGAGLPGHIAMSLGNGKTVEAMGHAWGVCVGNFDGRGWNNAGMMPGIDYATSAGPITHPPAVEGPEFNGEENMLVIPARAAVVNGRSPYFVLDMQSDEVLGYNGATLTWRMDKPTPPPEGHGTGDAFYRAYAIPTKGPHTGMDEAKDHTSLLPNNQLCIVAADGGCAFADMHYQGR